MSYFNEVAEYQSYSQGEADFHFIYNSNSGGGQSFLGGQFLDQNGKLSSPTVLDGCIGVFCIVTSEDNNQKKRILLNDEQGRYEIKPRGEGSTSMKLGVGTKMVSPNKLISSFFMLPSTCTIKTPKNLDISILTTGNYWLQSMWLECEQSDSPDKEVHLIPIDFIYCGGCSKDSNATGRFFKLDAARRIADIIRLSKNAEILPESIRLSMKMFADIYSGEESFSYDRCSEATARVMSSLSQIYPDKFSGIEDPLPFLMHLAFPSANENIHKSVSNNEPRQQIFYGAPGTGKSHKIKEYTQNLPVDNVFRTTFHPDSDYATFVGCYKPTKVRKAVRDMAGNIALDKNKNEIYEESITYEFVPQAFTKAYIRAWQTEEPVFLVIEEINRGNCAQIFGDLFQLLDRENNISEYPVKPDTDLGTFIHSEFKKNGCIASEESTVFKGEELILPANLYIWATMNTSDQSLFPIDSAFKRRWDWKYVPIENAHKNYTIEVNHTEYNWWEFLKAINKEVFELTSSEDKQLGYFFVKKTDGIIDAETLVNKVYFYLWNDIFKDYDLDGQKAFKDPETGKAISFKDFFVEGLKEQLAEQVLLNLELQGRKLDE